MENNVCSICGAHLSENNTEGIGFECKAALRQAKIHKLFQDKDFSLYYNWIIEASACGDMSEDAQSAQEAHESSVRGQFTAARKFIKSK